MKKKTFKITEQDLHRIIKKALNEQLSDDIEVTNGENETFGGSPAVNAAIEVLENWDWAVDQVSDTIIYAHLKEDANLQVVIDATKWYNVIIKEVHFKDDYNYGFNSSFCKDIEYLINKLAEIDA